jgi:hypothetical protein
MSNATLYVMSFSLIINFAVIFYLFFTGIGKDVYQRYRNKLLYRTGKYAYSLMADKSNNLIEVFEPIQEGTFTFRELPYTRDPLATIMYRGIPVNIHLEGQPVPKNLWDSSDRTNIGSEELDTVMNAENTFNFKRWLESNKSTIFIIVLVVIGLLAANVYFGYQNNDMLSQLATRSTELVPK